MIARPKLLQAGILGCVPTERSRVDDEDRLANVIGKLDVRTLDEYQAESYPNAKHIPIDELAGRMAEVGTDKSKPIVVYCGSGGRAGKAKRQLEAAGYTQVVNGGGLDDLR